ncbi:MAG: hypothetical protein A2Z38_01935 [Planctomycetes bacterium RBG_19FT_COMBO_48_8]|nr:MAG: hypothetical protein A2Z38_01935 [Planctomycetes bacterium RBG_19FT_COMBO_48_8]
MPGLLNPSRQNGLDDFMLKKAGREEEREKSKLGLCRFRPIINNTPGSEPVFMEIIRLHPDNA